VPVGQPVQHLRTGGTEPGDLGGHDPESTLSAHAHLGLGDRDVAHHRDHLVNDIVKIDSSYRIVATVVDNAPCGK